MNMLFRPGVLLVFFSTVALVLVNLEFIGLPAAHWYHDLVHYPIWINDYLGSMHDGHYAITPHYIVNDFLMALFFGIAAKEIVEAMLLRNGSLRGSKALLPLVATIGGVVGPAGIYIAYAFIFADGAETLVHGWAIPCATDIAFSVMLAHFLFGEKHPARTLLLAIAILDDVIGMIIIASYSFEVLVPGWILIIGIAMLITYLMHKIWRVTNFVAYLLIPGLLSWFGFAMAGIHPALALLPIIPLMPHAESDLGIFIRKEQNRPDALNQFEHWSEKPIQLILGLFGFVNAGVSLSSLNDATWAVLSGLSVGKTVFIFLFGLFGMACLKLALPNGMTKKDLLLVGSIAAIGFTVSLFMAQLRMPAGAFREGASMGALLSLPVAVIISYILAKMLGIRRMK